MRFTQIGAMYSELVALRSDGKVCQWKWADLEPYCSYSKEVKSFYCIEVLHF